MKIFLDSAEIKEIKEANDLGFLDGVTTNPSLIAKSNRNMKEVIKDIASLVQGPISAEVIATDFDGMIKEAEELRSIAEHIVIKIPLIKEGLKAVSHLSQREIQTNVTLCFSPNQALLAAKAGATYISPFIGRIDDTSWNGLDLITEIREIYDNYEISTQLLAASIRHQNHFKECALIGADCVTVPYSTLMSLFNHPLTDIGLKKFLKDAEQIQWK